MSSDQGSAFRVQVLQVQALGCRDQGFEPRSGLLVTKGYTAHDSEGS